MNKFNIGDRVVAKDSPHFGEKVGIIVGIDIRENASNKYLVKFASLDISEGWAYGYSFFTNNPELNIEPYEGRAVWLEEEDLTKVEEECEEEKCKEGEVCMSKFNIGDRVVAKDYPRIVKEVGVIVGIDPREDVPGKYLVKFDSLDGYNGWAYGVFINNPYYNIEPYEGRAIWLDDIEKVENESEEVCMSKFNIGDKVISKRYPYLGEELGVIVGIDTRESVLGKYLVNFNSLDPHEGWAYGCFRDNSIYIIEPYEGYAIWLEEEDLTKVEEECEEDKCEEGEVCMNEFNIGDKVISNDSCYSGKEVGIIVGIDPKAKASGKYLVKFDSIKGLEYRLFADNPNLIVEPYEGYAIWIDDIIKVEDESEEKCEEDKHEEDIRMEFDKIREEKREIIKGISEKVLEMTLEIKEMEHEIEKIKKEWHLD